LRRWSHHGSKLLGTTSVDRAGESPHYAMTNASETVKNSTFFKSLAFLMFTVRRLRGRSVISLLNLKPC
jgi:hypothetical protein